jgi:hypothetical protein
MSSDEFKILFGCFVPAAIAARTHHAAPRLGRPEPQVRPCSEEATTGLYQERHKRRGKIQL